MKKIIIFLTIFYSIACSGYLFAQENIDPKDEDVYSVLGSLFNWKTSWEKKDIDGYISFYDPDTTFLNLSINKFKARKKYIFQNAGKMELSVSNLCVEKKQDQIITKFIQYYEVKDRFDVGEKILTWAKKSKEWKIVSEQFTEIETKENIKSSPLGVKTLEKDKKEIVALKMTESDFKKIKVYQSVGITFKFIIDFPQSYKLNSYEPSIIHLNSSLIEGAIIYKYNNCSLKRGVIFLAPYKDYTIAASYDKGLVVFLIQN